MPLVEGLEGAFVAAESLSTMRVIQEKDVILNVYDVGNSLKMDYLNDVLYLIGTGVYHSGTQIGEKEEWAYGYTEKGSGVFHCKPRSYPFMFRKSVKLGKTPLTQEEIQEAIAKLATQFQGQDYDLLHCNCCHFAVALCQALQVEEVPHWVTSLAGAAAFVVDEEQAVQSELHNLWTKVLSGAEAVEESIHDAIWGHASTSLQGKIDTPTAPVPEKVSQCYVTDMWGRKKVTAKASDVLQKAGILEGGAKMCC
ncbi:unnamed protein product [Symbiodinium natans]|uniref:PPPDE domain-containing protein n=1 Tax=Symbiodinium natans TaxID=878477 RepID=A0A812TWL1_9DINO|nr:unnamed protein product [Symbiodinium natans]